MISKSINVVWQTFSKKKNKPSGIKKIIVALIMFIIKQLIKNLISDLYDSFD